MAEVTVIIPLYNKAGCIKRALRSILAQSYQDFELIVVDDGSTDDGAEVVRSVVDSRITLLQQANQGPGAARNAGIARAGTKYVAFLDADDEWYPWFLANCLAAARQNDVAMVSTMFYVWPEQANSKDNLDKYSIPLGSHCLQDDETPAAVVEILAAIKCWNTLLRTDIARKYDGFYEPNKCRLGEDQVLLFRVAFGERFMLIDPPAVRYHTEDSALDRRSEPRGELPYLADPAILLKYCPPEKTSLLKSVLDLWALRMAKRWGRFGLHKQARALLRRFPGARRYRMAYLDYLVHMMPGYDYWHRFKRKARRLASRLCPTVNKGASAYQGTVDMPYENSSNNTHARPQ